MFMAELQEKYIKAVAPYTHSGLLNFKQAPYRAWIGLGGNIASAYYPWDFLHGFVYRYELPTIWRSKKEARLRFVEPISISFDTFPDYALYEIIPMVWDCWPCMFEKMCAWLKKHDVRTAIFTSSQAAERIKERFPEMNVLFCPEGIDTSKYIAGKSLKDRHIDVLEFGRAMLNVNSNSNPNEGLNKRQIRYVCTKVDGKFVFTDEQLKEAMGDAKVTIAFPRSMTNPDVAGDIETLTQRYWESMLSRMVMVGHAPKELVDMIGYNPMVEVGSNENETLRYEPMEQRGQNDAYINFAESRQRETKGQDENNKGNINEEKIRGTVRKVLEHIEDYQELVDKNRETALKMGDWSLRAVQIMDFLRGCGYKV